MGGANISIWEQRLDKSLLTWSPGEAKPAPEDPQPSFWSLTNPEWSVVFGPSRLYLSWRGYSGEGGLWVFRGGVSNHTEQELQMSWLNRAEPFGKNMAFTAVSRLSWPLGGLRGLGGLRRRGGQVLLLIDLLHLWPLAAGLLLPVCSTVDEIRMVRDHKHVLLLVLTYTIWFYSGSTD